VYRYAYKIIILLLVALFLSGFIRVGSRNTIYQVNDRIQFGEYSWKIIAVYPNENMMLLLKYNIHPLGRFHHADRYVGWRDSDLNNFLNGEFLDSFSQYYYQRIIPTLISTDDNHWFGTFAATRSRASVFLLSVEEVVKYLGDSGQLDSSPNEKNYISDEYNASRRAFHNGLPHSWWLRSPAQSERRTAIVNTNGYIMMYSPIPNQSGIVGIRPAIWISIHDDTWGIRGISDNRFIQGILGLMAILFMFASIKWYRLGTDKRNFFVYCIMVASFLITILFYSPQIWVDFYNGREKRDKKK